MLGWGPPWKPGRCWNGKAYVSKPRAQPNKIKGYQTFTKQNSVQDAKQQKKKKRKTQIKTTVGTT